MIREEKYEHALYALHKIFIWARFMAYTNEPHKDIACLLDKAELLPTFIASEKDETEKFSGCLEDIARDFPYLTHVSHAFKEGSDLEKW